MNTDCRTTGVSQPQPRAALSAVWCPERTVRVFVLRPCSRRHMYTSHQNRGCEFTDRLSAQFTAPRSHNRSASAHESPADGSATIIDDEKLATEGEDVELVSLVVCIVSLVPELDDAKVARRRLAGLQELEVTPVGGLVRGEVVKKSSGSWLGPLAACCQPASHRWCRWRGAPTAVQLYIFGLYISYPLPLQRQTLS